MNLLAERGVHVTTDRFVVESQAYPMAALTKLTPFSVPAARGGLIIIGAIIAVMSVAFAKFNAVGGASLALLIAGGLWLFAAAKRPTHGLVLKTADQNVHVVRSKDRAFVRRVVGAFQQASTMR